MNEDSKGSFWQENKVYLGILGLILLLSLGGMYVLSQQEGQTMATVQQGQEILAEIDLNQVDEAYEWVIWSPTGEHNLLSIEPGRIAILEASCPDQICVNRGYSQGDGAPIVCLPNQVLIRFSGEIYDEYTG